MPPRRRAAAASAATRRSPSQLDEPAGSRPQKSTANAFTAKKLALGMLLTSPGLAVISVRLADFAMFDPRLNMLGLTPTVIFIMYMIYSVLIVIYSARRPWSAGVLASLIAFAAKLYMDHVSAPLLGPCDGAAACTSLVTGANSGIGLALAQTLAAQGHTVLMACRRAEACEDARRAVLEHVRSAAASAEADHALAGRVQALPGLDLASLPAVTKFVTETVGSRPAAIDYVFANAGFVPVGNHSTPVGLEAGLGASHFGHFHLVRSLRSAGAFKRGAAVVLVSSDASRLGAFHDSLMESPSGEGDLNGEYTVGCETPFPFCLPPTRIEGLRKPLLGLPFGFGAYTRAKLANVLLARRLAKDGEKKSGGFLFASSVHPGTVYTRLAEQVAEPFAWAGGVRIQTAAMQAATMQLLLRPPLTAAAIVMRAALAAKASPGAYCNGMGQAVPDSLLPAHMIDDELAEKLWQVSERIVRESEAL